MEHKTDEDISEIKKLHELERSVSLCSLCVLETGCDFYRRSNSFAPSLSSIDESFIVSLEQQETENDNEDSQEPTNYLSKFFDTTKFNDQKIIQDRRNSRLNDPNKNGGIKLTPPSFDNDNISQSLLDVLSRLERTKSRSLLNKPSQDLWNDIGETINDSDTISQQLEIAPNFSQAVVERIINDDNILIENRTNFEDESKRGERTLQADDPKKIVEKGIATSVDKKNCDSPRCYNSDISDNEIPCKKMKCDDIVPHDESSTSRKREKPFDPRESRPMQEISRKKPKIITDGIIKIDRKILTTNLMIFPNNLEDAKTTTSNENQPIVMRTFQSAPKKLNNADEKKSHKVESKSSTNEPKKTANFESNNEDREKIPLPENYPSKARKNEEGTKMENLEIGMEKNSLAPTSTKNSPIHSPLHRKNIRTRTRPPPTLTMLQNKIAKSYKLLIDGAEDLKNLSLFIDDLREGFTRPETRVAPQPKKLRKTLVCASTQTSAIEKIPNYFESKIPIAEIEIPTIKSKSTENKLENRPKNLSNFQNFVNDRNRFCEPLEEQDNRANVTNEREPQKRCTSPSIDVESKKTRIENQQENATMIDKNYNPLRPRRWPNNRYNNFRTLRGNRSNDPQNPFPPLSIVKLNKK